MIGEGLSAYRGAGQAVVVETSLIVPAHAISMKPLSILEVLRSWGCVGAGYGGLNCSTAISGRW